MRSRAAGRQLAALLPPLALAALGIVFGRFAADRAAALWSTALALLAAAILALLARAAGGSRDGLAVIALALAPAIFLFDSGDPLGLAAWTALLAAAVVVVAADPPSEGGLGAGRWVALALATQAIVHADLLLVAPVAAPTLATVLALPVAAALAIAWLERLDPAGARLAALATFAAGPAWTVWGIAALAAGAACGLVRPVRRFAPLVAAVAAGGSAAWSGEPKWIALSLAGMAATAFHPSQRLARAARTALVAGALVALVAGGMPWRRPAPLATALRRAGDLASARIDAFSFAARVRALSPEANRLELELTGAPIRRVSIDSFLIDGAALPCGTPVGRVELRRGEVSLFAAEIRVGEGATEWAAERPDLRGRVACMATSAPTAWLPPGGRFVARRDRSRIELPEPAAGDRLVIERDPDLPPALRWVLVGVTTWR